MCAQRLARISIAPATVPPVSAVFVRDTPNCFAGASILLVLAAAIPFPLAGLPVRTRITIAINYCFDRFDF